MHFDNRPRRPSDPRMVIVIVIIGAALGSCATVIWIGQFFFSR